MEAYEENVYTGHVGDADSFFASDPQGQQEYEQKPYPVMCDICEAEDFAPEKTLRAKGWELGRGYEFCPSH